jgi:membrane protease YdiL (CAAX protease family)
VLDDPRADDLSRRDLAWRAAVEITIGTSLYEELVFRSALLALARERFSEPVAVGGTAALFGLWHVLPALEDRAHNPVAQKLPLLATVGPTVAATAAAGLGFTWLRRRGGHVLAPIVTHAMVNTASLVAASAARARRRR